MNKEKLERELRYTKEKHKNDKLCTFSTDISGMCHDVLDVLSRCIEIPDGATNGDMILAMFPNAKIKIHKQWDEQNIVTVRICGVQFMINSLEWWNAPYEGGKE